MFWILNEAGDPVDIGFDAERWSAWRATEDCQVARDVVGDTLVSTVFIAIDHGFNDVADVPALWETLVFGGKSDGRLLRYSSRQAAVEGHAAILSDVLLGV